jgi:hypothetical protein
VEGSTVAKYHGKRGRAYISTTGSTAATAVVGLNAWNLDMPTDKVEVSEFGDTNKTYVQGLRDATGAVAGFWDDTSDTLYDASASTDPVNVYLYPSLDAVTKYFYGKFWVDFSINTGMGQAVQVSANLAAGGSIGQM